MRVRAALSFVSGVQPIPISSEEDFMFELLKTRLAARSPQAHAAARDAGARLAPPTRLVMALEPRMVFDGAAVDTFAETVRTSAGEAPASAHLPREGGAGEGGDTILAVAAFGTPVAEASTLREIAFIDAGVADLSVLLKGIGAGTEVVLLDPAKDGVEQIAAALQGRTDVSAIHILSHGSPGSLSIGIVGDRCRQHAGPLPRRARHHRQRAGPGCGHPGVRLRFRERRSRPGRRENPRNPHWGRRRRLRRHHRT